MKLLIDIQKNMPEKMTLPYLVKNLGIVVGLVLVWRGIWHMLDGVDMLFFGGNHIWTGLGGIVVGLLILYLPDKDLKEIQKL
jgi:cytochrome b561